MNDEQFTVITRLMYLLFVLQILALIIHAYFVLLLFGVLKQKIDKKGSNE